MDLGASSTFVVELPESDVMKRRPRNPKESIMNRNFNIRVLSGGVALFLGVLIAFLLGGPKDNVDRARSMAFATWMYAHFLLGFNFRTNREPVIRHGLFSNKLMPVWFGAVMIVSIFVLYVPVLQELMRLVSLPAGSYFLTLLFALLCTCWIEVFKWLKVARCNNNTQNIV